MATELLTPQTLGCPYCHAVLETGVFSCRYCSRDLTPVLPLLSRIAELDNRLSKVEAQLKSVGREQPLLPILPPNRSTDYPVLGPRRFLALPVGFIALLLAYATVVFWLDLPLSFLRLSSIVIPLAAGFAFLGARYRFHRFDALVAVLFSALSVLAMNAILSFVDSIPILPADTAAWRETMFYVLSIAASMVSGMLLRMTIMALGVRGMTSLPRLRQGLLNMNKSMPLDTLKAIELSVLLFGTLLSAITGLFAGIMGLTG